MAPSRLRAAILASADRMMFPLPEKDTDNTRLGAKSKNPKKRPSEILIKSEHASKRVKLDPNQKRKVRFQSDAATKSPDVCLQPTTPSKLNALPRLAIPIFSDPGEPAVQERISASKAQFSISSVTELLATSSNLAVLKSRTVEAIAAPQISANIPASARDKEHMPDGASEDFDDGDDHALFEELLQGTPDVDTKATYCGTKGSQQHENIASSGDKTTPNAKDCLPPPSQELSEVSSAAPSGLGSPIRPFVRLLPSSQPIEGLISMPWLNEKPKIETCFRIAEVLRIQSPPVPIHAGVDYEVKIELFARVKSTNANGSTVHFADLFFPDRPPFLTGICKTDESTAVMASLASASAETLPPFTQSSQSTAGENHYKICRAIIQTKLSSKAVSIFKVKEVEWDEIEHVKGIVEPIHQDMATEATQINRRHGVSLEEAFPRTNLWTERSVINCC